MSIKSLYLFLFSFFQVIGWTLFFIQYTLGLLNSKSIEEIYKDTIYILAFTQYTASLEIISSYYSLVNTSLCVTIIETIGRVFVVLFLQYIKSSLSIGYFMLYLGCPLIEILKYLLYLVNIRNPYKESNSTYIHIWSRYSLLIILYPFDIVGEILTMWNSTEDLQNISLLGIIPYSYLIYPLILFYALCLMYIYSYYFKIRRISLRKYRTEIMSKIE